MPKPKLTFGLFSLFSLPPWKSEHQVFQDEMEQARVADELGFDKWWIAEHNARPYGMVGSAHVMAAALAASTKRIRIGIAVTRLPLHHPVHLAQDLALVDHISKGRLDWGIGKGYDSLEFETYGQTLEDREERFAETLACVRKIWETGNLEWNGRYYKSVDAPLYPKPYQQPHPPIYMTVTRSDSSVVWAAERGFSVILGQRPDWDDTRHKLQIYRETAEKAGHSPEKIEEMLSSMGSLRHVHVADTDQRAKDEYEKGLMWYFQTRDNRYAFGFPVEPQPYEYYLDHKSVILGSVEKVREELHRYHEYTGVRHIVLWFNCGGQPQEQVLRAMNTFAEKIMPEFK